MSAEAALANYKAVTAIPDVPHCARDADPDEIVICGRDVGASQRLPLPHERGAAAGPRRATGELPAASAAPVRSGSCGTRAGDQCNGGLPVIGAAIVAAKAIGKIIEGDD